MLCQSNTLYSLPLNVQRIEGMDSLNMLVIERKSDKYWVTGQFVSSDRDYGSHDFESAIKFVNWYYNVFSPPYGPLWLGETQRQRRTV